MKTATLNSLRARLRRQSPIRYQKGLKAHELVAGYPIEHVLRLLLTNPRATSAVRELAKQVLVHGNTDALYPHLDDALQEAEHPFHELYNWKDAGWKLKLDADVGKAATDWNGSEQQRRDGINRGILSPIDRMSPVNPHDIFFALRLFAESGFNPSHWSADFTRPLVDGLRAKWPHLTPADFHGSFQRHINRLTNDDFARENPELARDAFPIHATARRPDPVKYPGLAVDRYARKDSGLGATINAEFGKLADRLGAPDAESFKQRNHYGYLLTVAKGDHDLAHDMATHLLYGQNGESPLAKNYDPSRPLGARLTGYADYLPALVGRQNRETRSDKFAGTFTDVSAPDSRVDPADRQLEESDTVQEAKGFTDSARRTVAAAKRYGNDNSWIADKLGVGEDAVPHLKKRLTEIRKQKKAAYNRWQKAKRITKPDTAHADRINSYLAERPDGVRISQLQSDVGLPMTKLRELLGSLGHSVKDGYFGDKKTGRMTTMVFPKGVAVPEDNRLDRIRQIVALKEKGESNLAIGRKLGIPRGSISEIVRRAVAAKQKYSRNPHADSRFLDALRRVHSVQQQKLEQIAHEIASSLSLNPVSVKTAIQDHQNGTAINSIGQTVFHQTDPDTVTYSAAMLGHLTQAPGLMVFHVHDDGPDSVYKVRATGSGEGIREALDRHGISQRTLLPTDQGFDVLVADPGSRMLDRVRRLATELKSPVWHSTGTAEILGGQEVGPRAGAATRKSYRSVITQYEQGQQQQQGA